MVGVDGDGDGDGGSRRRLPSWMLGIAQNQETQKNNACMATSTQVITHNNNVVAKKNRLGRKRKDETVNNNENDDAVEEELPHNNVVKKKSRLGRKRKDKSVNNSGNYDAEEEELTVEDLLSIAKEYVEADAVKDELEPMNTRRAKFLEKDSNSVELSPAHPMTLSLNGATTTGDPAQDMLNLFLGPLLNKPLEQEKKKPEFTEYDSNKFRKLSQSHTGEEVAAPMKTKSSLKDKVAMLLD